MSGAVPCRCPSLDRSKWRITQFRCNHSAFNGYRRTPSDYSGIRCLECGSFWRTKAKYVEELAMSTTEESSRAI
jgi:hypothetical protein